MAIPNIKKTFTVSIEDKLLIDGPLGKLARWMRIMGYYCHYDPDLTSSLIITLAKEKKLFLFTKSLNTAKQAKLNEVAHILVNGKIIQEQLISLVTQNVQIDIPEIHNARCSICNGNLRIIIDKTVEIIPKKSLEHYDQFFKCLNCNQIYWEGSHWKKIRNTISTVLI